MTRKVQHCPDCGEKLDEWYDHVGHDLCMAESQIALREKNKGREAWKERLRLRALWYDHDIGIGYHPKEHAAYKRILHGDGMTWGVCGVIFAVGFVIIRGIIG